MKTTIVRDPKNPGHEFWLHVDNDPSAPIELKYLLSGAALIVVSDERAEAIIDYCKNAPGYSGGRVPHQTPVYFLG